MVFIRSDRIRTRQSGRWLLSKQRFCPHSYKQVEPAQMSPNIKSWWYTEWRGYDNHQIVFNSHQDFFPSQNISKAELMLLLIILRSHTFWWNVHGVLSNILGSNILAHWICFCTYMHTDASYYMNVTFTQTSPRVDMVTMCNFQSVSAVWYVWLKTNSIWSCRY